MDPEESSIERLKRNLYSRNEKLVPKEKRTPVSPHEVDVRQNWGDDTNFNFSPEAMAKKNNSFFNKFLVGSLVFFAIALGIAVFIFYGGLNMISSNNLDINIVAPSSISSGESFSAGLTIINSNRTDLEEVSLFIEYPEGSESVVEEGRTLSRDKIDVGVIAKGKSSNYNIQAFLFGEKDSIKTFKLKLEYKVKGSNAVFSKEKTFDVQIGSSPVIMDIDYPKEVNSGQTVTLNINLTSNSGVPVKNVLLKIEYPYGFTYKDSNITAYRDTSLWNLGDLNDGEKKTLTIRGSMIGQNQEDRSFRVSVGSESADRNKDFDTALATGIFTIGIRKSFFGLDVVTNKNNVANVGESIPVVIKYQNTLPDKILSTSIQATLSGNAFDRNRVSTGNGGFYRSVDNTVVWDKKNNPSLESLLPGDYGQVTINVSSFLDLTTAKLIKNPHVDLHVIVMGIRSGADNAEITSEEDVVVKISTNLGLRSRSYRNYGPFKNSGPIPPRADNESTYTVNWMLSNSTNDVSGAVVTAKLPAGVVWKGETSPLGEKISYDQEKNTVTWSPGNISAGVGYGFAPREVYFKVGVTPSINQIGLVAQLVTAANVTATDTYTEQPVSASALAANSQYSDTDYRSTDGIVSK